MHGFEETEITLH